MEAWKSEGDFQARVRSDPEVQAVLRAEEIAEVFRLERYLEHVGRILVRALAAEPEVTP